MRSARLACAVLALLPLITACSGDGWQRARCDPARPHGAGLTTVQLRSGGDDRSAALFVPKSYDGTAEHPIVLNWHGYGSNAQEHLRYADLLPIAEKDGFLVVAPQGTGSPSRFGLGAGITAEVDDVAFANDLLDILERDLCVDERRVYSVGVSNGGGMSGVLACRAPSRFAAVAMVALLLKPEGCDSPSLSVLGIMGDADLVVPIQGGRVNCCGGWDIAPAADTMQRWADALGCHGSDDDQVAAHVERRTWHRCEGDRDVVYYLVHGGGHTWPGAGGNGPLGPTNREISASEIIWDFFADHTTAN